MLQKLFFCCRFVFLFARRSFVESMDSHGDCCLVTCYFRFFLLCCYNSRWVELNDVVFFLSLPDFFLCSFSSLFSSARSTMFPNRSFRSSYIFLITVLIPLPGWRSQENNYLACRIDACFLYVERERRRLHSTLRKKEKHRLLVKNCIVVAMGKKSIVIISRRKKKRMRWASVEPWLGKQFGLTREKK